VSVAPTHAPGISPSLTTDPLLDLVTLLLVGGTVALAIYTAKLHAATVSLAEDTVKATKVSDRHHQESLSPICVLKEVECVLVLARHEATTEERSVVLTFAVENLGYGPALELTVSITPVNAVVQPTGKTEVHELGSLKPGNSTPPFGPILENVLVADGYLVKLKYDTIFGAIGTSAWHVTYGSASRAQSTTKLSFGLPPPQQRSL